MVSYLSPAWLKLQKLLGSLLEYFLRNTREGSKKWMLRRLITDTEIGCNHEEKKTHSESEKQSNREWNMSAGSFIRHFLKKRESEGLLLTQNVHDALRWHYLGQRRLPVTREENPKINCWSFCIQSCGNFCRLLPTHRERRNNFLSPLRKSFTEKQLLEVFPKKSEP